MKRRTSFSIPASTEKKLRRLSQTRGKSLLTCLKFYHRNFRALQKTKKSTCFYNRRSCKKKVFAYLSESEFRSLKILRFYTGKSVSLLCFEAIEYFTRQGSKKQNYLFKRAPIEATFTSFHLKTAFLKRNLVGLRIVMPKPG